MKKHVLPLLLALVLCLGTLPHAALAAQSDFTVKGGVLTAYTGPGGDVTIPENVTAIGEYAFFGCAGLTALTIPGTVTTIGEGAFGECDSLTQVTIAPGVKSIGDKAFGWCDELAAVTIPDTVTSIGEMAFQACVKLDNVVIPGSVKTIGNDAFGNCTALTSLTLSDGITTIGNGAFYGCSGLTSVIIPDSVVTIEANAFAYCFKVAEIVLPKGLTTIESYAFHGCAQVTDLTIPDGVTTIASRAFDECYNLARLTLPASVTSIGEYAFAFIYMEDVYYGGSEDQWAEIKIGEYNDPLVSAVKHYNSTGPAPEEPQEPAQPELPEEPAAPAIPESGTSYTSTQGVAVDGKAVTFHAYALRDENGNDTNFVRLRDIAAALNGTAGQFAVGYDEATDTISLETGKGYTTVGGELTQIFTGDQAYKAGKSPLKINGVLADLTAITLTDANGGESNYFKLRDLGRALGFNVGYSDETGIFIQTDKPYTDAD